MTKNLVIVILSTLMLASCATAGSSAVRRTKNEPDKDSGCEYLGEVRGKGICGWGEKAYYNCIKNDAAELGGNTIVALDNSSTHMVYKCPR